MMHLRQIQRRELDKFLEVFARRTLSRKSDALFEVMFQFLLQTDVCGKENTNFTELNGRNPITWSLL